MTPLIALLVLGQPLPAVEMTFSEAQQSPREKIAFVDMERIFEEFPGTKRAQAELNELIFSKRQLLKTKAQETAMLKAAITMLEGAQSPHPPTGTAPSVSITTGGATSVPVVPSLPVSPPAAPVSSTSTSISSVSSTSTLVPSQSLPSASFSTVASWLQPSTGTLTGGVVPSTAPSIPSVTSPATGGVSSSTETAKPTPLSTEAELAAKRQELAKQEQGFEELTRQINRDIRRMEEEKSLAVMARIYRALEEVANEESVTLIVDRQHVLYSKSALDLTEMVRQRLRGKS